MKKHDYYPSKMKLILQNSKNGTYVLYNNITFSPKSWSLLNKQHNKHRKVSKHREPLNENPKQTQIHGIMYQYQAQKQNPQTKFSIYI